MKTKERMYGKETLAEVIARNEAYDREVEALPHYKEYAEEFDREYEAAKLMEAAREHAKLTQSEVAKKMGTTQSVLARMFHSNITLNDLASYLKACGAQLKIAACYM